MWTDKTSGPVHEQCHKPTGYRSWHFLTYISLHLERVADANKLSEEMIFQPCQGLRTLRALLTTVRFVPLTCIRWPVLTSRLKIKRSQVHFGYRAVGGSERVYRIELNGETRVAKVRSLLVELPFVANRNTAVDVMQQPPKCPRTHRRRRPLCHSYVCLLQSTQAHTRILQGRCRWIRAPSIDQRRPFLEFNLSFRLFSDDR